MLTIERIKRYCGNLPASEETFPFDAETLVFKVMGKIYALLSLDGELSINMKCEPNKAIELRASYPSVVPGYHMNKKHWNTVFVDGSIDDEVIFEMISHSYQLVVNALPGHLRNALESLKKL